MCQRVVGEGRKGPPIYLTVETENVNSTRLAVTKRMRRPQHQRYVPLPMIVTICGEPPPLSNALTTLDRVPFTFGLKVTLTVQLAPAPTAVPQLFVWKKSPSLPLGPI